MKNHFRSSAFVMLLALSILFSCDNSSPEPAKDAGEVYVKAIFENPNGSIDVTRITYLKYNVLTGAAMRTLSKVQVSSTITLEQGDYDEIELLPGANLTLDGIYHIGEIKFSNNGSPVEVHAYGEVRIASSFNLNGGVKFYNNAELYTLSMEIQNGINWFENTNKHFVTGDIQVTSPGSEYHACGQTEVSNFFNVHQGSVEFCRCGSIITSGLNVNRSDGFSGQGFLKVLNNLNLNNRLTTSDKINFCFNANINDPSKIGSAKRSCNPDCPALPVKYTNLKINTVLQEGKAAGQISFMVTENTGLRNMKLLTSVDGINWTERFEESSSSFVAGQEYKRIFDLR